LPWPLFLGISIAHPYFIVLLPHNSFFRPYNARLTREAVAPF
jgi:hypothetical protein